MPVKSSHQYWSLAELRISFGRTVKFRLVLDTKNQPKQFDARLFTAKGVGTKVGINIPVEKISDISVVLSRVVRRLKGIERDFGKTT